MFCFKMKRFCSKNEDALFQNDDDLLQNCDCLFFLKLKKKPIVCFETHSSQYKSYPKKKVSMKKSKKVGNVINVRKVETRNLSTMEKALKKMFKIGYKVKFASTSYEKGSIQLKKNEANHGCRYRSKSVPQGVRHAQRAAD